MHVINWHYSDMYSKMYELALEGKSYISVLYNLTLITSFSAAIGLLMGRITDLFKRDTIDKTASIPGNKKVRQ